jgi:3-deoxy-D-manno-octulosonate 8-phosphate phosphatase KdsC-like HAD superfamily phosphatase
MKNKNFITHYFGISNIVDDLNDYNIIKLVGFSATPANGINQLKEIVNYVKRKKLQVHFKRK